MSRMVIVMAVILALKSRASTATGAAIASQAPLSTVQTTRLIKGRLMKPASSAREATARPEASVSLPRGSLVEEPTLSRLFTPPARSACLPAVSFPFCRHLSYRQLMLEKGYYPVFVQSARNPEAFLRGRTRFFLIVP